MHVASAVAGVELLVALMALGAIRCASRTRAQRAGDLRPLDTERAFG